MDTNRTPLSKEIVAWAFYDFANSAFFTSVSSAIFNVYFIDVVVGPAGLELFGFRFEGAVVWSFAVALSMLVVLVAMPVLGAVADVTGCKKLFVFVFCYLGVFCTAMLFWATPGAVGWAASFFMLANAFMAGSLPFYNSFLFDICERDRLGWVSGFGWAVGYIGGVSCLALNLLMIRHSAALGLEGQEHLSVRASMVVVAVWWALFALPLFLFLADQPKRVTAKKAALSYVRVGFTRVARTLTKVRRYREVVKFLGAYLIYNDGVETVILMAAPFGATVLGMELQELLLCLIVNQVVAFLGALIIGPLADRFPAKRVVSLTLLVWGAAALSALFIQTPGHFWILSIAIGVVLGATQSVSRTLFGRMIPESHSAEFFGFYATVQKSSAVIGPAVFGLMVILAGGLRGAVASIVLFFLLGLLLLMRVDEGAGVEAAQPEHCRRT